MTKIVEKKPSNHNSYNIKEMPDPTAENSLNSANSALIDTLLNETTFVAMNTLSPEPEDIDNAIAKVKSMMSAIISGNGLEEMVAAQMASIHCLQTTAATYAKHQQHANHKRTYVNMATKLSNTFIQQAQFLSKLQGKGQQKVTVEHVNVHKGGQAIVGNISNNKGDINE